MSRFHSGICLSCARGISPPSEFSLRQEQMREEWDEDKFLVHLKVIAKNGKMIDTKTKSGSLLAGEWPWNRQARADAARLTREADAARQAQKEEARQQALREAAREAQLAAIRPVLERLDARAEYWRKVEAARAARAERVARGEE